MALYSDEMKLSWNTIDGIQQRAAARGLARKVHDDPKRIAVDDTSFQKRHEHVTVVTDHEKGIVLHVADNHKADSLNKYFETLTLDQKVGIKCVTMAWPVGVLFRIH